MTGIGEKRVAKSVKTHKTGMARANIVLLPQCPSTAGSQFLLIGTHRAK